MAIEVSRRTIIQNKPSEMKTQMLRESPKENVDNRNRKKMENILDELSGTNMNIAYEGIFGDTSLDVEQSLSKDSPIIIKGFSAIMVNAVEVGATDIHIEAYEESVRIRYRVDGGLIEVKKLGKSVLNALVSRVKILSNLDIAERRLPQDGRMKLRILGKDIDFRIAIMPTVFGEKVAIRILDKTALDMKLDKLGFDEEEYEKIIKAISKPHGIILVTGPTGSGKSTTLYSILNNLNTEDVNISTVEDPVEYNIDGINQVQAKPEIGLTFAASLRQFLRQDPDIIMVGEVRDGETAEIAIKAALTGHLVLSTLHTNDAVGTIFRLMNMGVQPFLISASLVMVISQRLIRKLCPECKEEDEEFSTFLRMLEVDPREYWDKTFYKPGYNNKECPICGGKGY
ncbi:MAG: GspE/PulE family protein, partial [Fusobacteriaceae bacterium]